MKDLPVQPTATDANGNSILFNPATGRGWRGPYVVQATGTFLATLEASFFPSGNPYGSVGDVAFLDAWGSPIVLQWPSVGSSGLTDPTQNLAARVNNARLVSAGPVSANVSGKMAYVIDMPLSALVPSTPSRGNDLVLFLLTQDPTP